jgi:hypothetical protein
MKRGITINFHGKETGKEYRIKQYFSGRTVTVEDLRRICFEIRIPESCLVNFLSGVTKHLSKEKIDRMSGVGAYGFPYGRLK